MDLIQSINGLRKRKIYVTAIGYYISYKTRKKKSKVLKECSKEYISHYNNHIKMY